MPIFRSHTVLKATTLSEGIKVSTTLIEQIYKEYSDGIIAGVELKIEGNDLVIQPGVIKYNQCLYVLEEEERIPYQADGVTSFLRIQFYEKQEREDRVIWNSEIYLTKEIEARTNDMELCRFVLKEGAVLRQDYKDFHDLNTMHNTLNQIEVRYAGKGEPTISPVLTQIYGDTLEKLGSQDPLDMVFMMECFRGNPVARKIIKTYIQKKLSHIEKKEMTNQEIYQNLKKILEQIRQTGGQRKAAIEINRRMIID